MLENELRWRLERRGDLVWMVQNGDVSAGETELGPVEAVCEELWRFMDSESPGE